MKITIPSYDAFMYLEVWEITEWRDGLVYKTKSTGMYISYKDEQKLDKRKYTTSSISTRLLRQANIELELMEIS